VANGDAANRFNAEHLLVSCKSVTDVLVGQDKLQREWMPASKKEHPLGRRLFNRYRMGIIVQTRWGFTIPPLILAEELEHPVTKFRPLSRDNFLFPSIEMQFAMRCSFIVFFS